MITVIFAMYRDFWMYYMQFQFLTGRYCTFVQPGLAFMQAVKLFDSQQAETLTFSSFSANIPGADCTYMLEETAAYKQAVGETDSDVQPLTYWFANKERFPHLFDLAIRYLSVPTNSVYAERSVSQYMAVSAPQRQSFSDMNLALQVIAAFNAETRLAVRYTV